MNDLPNNVNGHTVTASSRLIPPTRDVPDNVHLTAINLPPRHRNALLRAGLRTVGDVRNAPDSFISLQRNVGRESFRFLRDGLGRGPAEPN